MVTVKEAIVRSIEDISDKSILIEIHRLIHNISFSRKTYVLNPEQRANIEEAIKEYKAGKFYTTDELFDDLIGG